MDNDLDTLQCQCENFNTPCILVHGGAEDYNDALIIEKMISCKKAASNGYQSLLNGGSPVQAVETALWWLECDEFFNCGYGSVLNEIGDVQMDASIIDGFKSKCGSVAAVSDIEHPITLARYVLESFPNSIVVGDGAKELARYAKLNWLSKGNMIAPTADLAYKLQETGSSDANWDIENYQHAELLKNSTGSAVGCVAYDGYTIAAGVTSGGLNKKLAGSVSGSSILGCNAYANRNVGCSLTGHGDSIMKLGLSRSTASDIEQGCLPWKALKKNLDYMLTKYNYSSGGIAFKKSGEWGIYFTSNKMPYATVMNDCIISGTTLNDKNVEAYIGYQKHFPYSCSFSFVNNFISELYLSLSETYVIIDEGISDTRLFSFREWQRYIECRRTVLVNTHFPTKLKYNPNIPDVNSLYIKFLESIHSKTDRQEPEITTHKHLIPRDLIHAMKQCITNVNCIDLPLNEVNVFAPTLTPHHSYIQQLLDHPLYDIPSILRNDFFSTKIGYMTKSEFIYELAARYDIKLDLIDSNLHFIEKTVPFFEQTKMTSVKDLKDGTVVYDIIEEDVEHTEKKEDFTNYLHRKIPCQFKIDVKKKQYYDEIRNTITDIKAPILASSNEFIFDEILPNGKLSIPDRDDNYSEDDDASLKDIPEEMRLSLSNFCKAYDINLSNTEKRAISTNSSWKKKQKRKPVRNAHGKFVKQNEISHNIENPNEDNYPTEETEVIQEENIEGVLPEILDILSLSDMSIFNDFMKTEIEYDDQSTDCSKAFKSAIGKSYASDKKTDNTPGLFRPFKDYWMYHCNFSRVKPKNFELLEKTLPRSFRWLLNECASIIETSTDDLYEEVCLVEAYYASISEQSEIHMPSATNTENRNQAYINAILSKW